MFTEHVNCATHVHRTPELCHSCSSLSLQGSKSFLRSWQLLSCTRNARCLRNSQDHYRVQNTTTCHYREPDESYPPLILSFKIYFNIVIPSRPSPSQWFPSFVPTNTVCISFASECTTRPPPPVSSHLIGHPINTW